MGLPTLFDQNWGLFEATSSILFGGLSRIACKIDLTVYSGRPCAKNGQMKLADSAKKLDFCFEEWSKSGPKLSQNGILY
jgi:hypothetical protein